MAGDSHDDEGFTEGTLFDMDATLEESPGKSDSFDDELEATGAWIPVQEEKEESAPEPSDDEDEDGAGKTAVLSVEDVLGAEKRSAGNDVEAAVEEEAPAAEPVGPEDSDESEEALDEPLEKTFVMEINDLGEVQAEEEPVAEDEEATMALNLAEEEVDETEEATVLFQIPVSEPSVRVRLHGVEGPDEGGEWELKEDSIVLGRSKECDLSVKDPTASRKHIRLDWNDGHYHFEDLGSGNGTTRNGQKEQSGALKDGDRIQLGQSIFRVEVVGQVASPVEPLKAAVPVTPVVEELPTTTEAPSIRAMAPAIGGTVFLLVVLVWYFSGSGEEEVSPEKSKVNIEAEEQSEAAPGVEGDAAYDEGLEFAKQGEWEKALVALQKAANSDPKNETYQKALSRAEEEISHVEKLARGKKLIEQGQPGDALDVLRSIPDSADVFATAAEEIRTQEQKYEQVEGERIRQEILGGGYDGIKDAAVAFAGRLPGSEDAQGLKAAVEKGKRAAVRFVKGRAPAKKKSVVPSRATSAKSSSSEGKVARKAAVKAPKEVVKKKSGKSGVVDKALSLHRSRKLDAAISVLVSERDAGNQSPRMMKTLSDLQSFDAAYKKGKAASGSKAIKPLERAYKVDQRLGGSYANEIGSVLSDRLGIKAAEYYASGTYGSAAIYARKALKYDRDHVNAAGVLKKCQKKAVDFYEQGMSALKSGNNGVARTFLNLAVDILPQGDSKRAEAKKALGSL